ncbi:MAG: hypothetical protein GY710_25600 [Desulfobacteraceae bacterium]|nr:hypothetical protein [Desulfobacteraceae bacterium]
MPDVRALNDSSIGRFFKHTYNEGYFQLFSINRLIVTLAFTGFLLLFHFDAQAVKSNENEIVHSKKILKKIEQAYKNVETYHDRGTLITATEAYAFESIYKAQKFFQITWIGSDSIKGRLKKFRITKSRKDIIAYSTWFKDKQPQEFNSLKDAILKLYPSSFGLLLNIPGQLFENLGFTPLTNLTGYEFIGEEVLNDELCIVFKIRKKVNNRNIEYRVWTSKNSYFIRKVERVDSKFTFLYDYKYLKINEPLNVKESEL